MRSGRVIRSSLWILAFAVLASRSVSSRTGRFETTIENWDSYVNSPTGVQITFSLTNYEHGHFVGPCGPSTLSLQWSYRFELIGAGPLYKKEEVMLKSFDVSQSVAVNSGTVFVDSTNNTVQIAIKISTDGGNVEDFVGNGSYRTRTGILPDDDPPRIPSVANH
jgi:hypothetical protein